MSETTLGTIIATPTAERDAIHVAVTPVTCDAVVYPGQHLTLVEGSNVKVKHTGTLIGVADPFLRTPVPIGQRFWLCLYPQTVTSLRHAWTHPAFNFEAPALIVASAPATTPSVSQAELTRLRRLEAAIAWITAYAVGIGLDYRDLMDGTRAWLLHGDYLVRGGLLEGVSLPDEFWERYQAATGYGVPMTQQQSFFSCSC